MSPVDDFLKEEFIHLREKLDLPFRSKPPRILYHYTSSEGLLGILESKKLWATNVNYVNDSSEINYGCELAQKEIRKKLKDNTLSAAAREFLFFLLESDFWRGLDAFFNVNNPKKSKIFVICFCSNGNILNQWQGYGSQGSGFSIGFSREGILKNDIEICKVIYEPSKQISLINDLLNNTCQIIDNAAIKNIKNKNQIIFYCALEAAYYFRRYCVCFKNKAFSIEKEWRIILEYDEFLLIREGKFRTVKNNITPYVEFPLCKPKELLPIKEIYCGPTLHPEITQQTIQILLKNHMYFKRKNVKEIVTVHQSGIPYRTSL